MDGWVSRCVHGYLCVLCVVSVCLSVHEGEKRVEGYGRPNKRTQHVHMQNCVQTEIQRYRERECATEKYKDTEKASMRARARQHDLGK